MTVTRPIFAKLTFIRRFFFVLNTYTHFHVAADARSLKDGQLWAVHRAFFFVVYEK